jgi:hypothetical protein
MKLQSVRERGPSYPQQKPNGRWLAESYMPHRGRYVRSYHDDFAKAQKRLNGCPLHTLKRIIDTQPPKVQP